MAKPRPPGKYGPKGVHRDPEFRESFGADETVQQANEADMRKPAEQRDRGEDGDPNYKPEKKE